MRTCLKRPEKKVKAMHDDEDSIVSLLPPHACTCIRMTRTNTHYTHMYTKNKVNKKNTERTKIILVSIRVRRESGKESSFDIRCRQGERTYPYNERGCLSRA